MLGPSAAIFKPDGVAKPIEIELRGQVTGPRCSNTCQPPELSRKRDPEAIALNPNSRRSWK